MAEEKKQEEPLLLSMIPFAGLGLLLLLALLWRYLPARDPAAPPTAEDRVQAVIEAWDQTGTDEIPIAETDFTLGPEDAPVTLVEFSDFQCPYCRTGAESVREVLAAHPEEVRLVFKNFPLDTACNESMQEQLHPLACRAALAARCAGASGSERFWQAHDLLFEAPLITEELLAKLPEELSLPREEFERCLSSEEAVRGVKDDIRQGRKLGVNGTPAFFVNGRRAADYRDRSILRLVEHVLAGRSQS